MEMKYAMKYESLDKLISGKQLFLVAWGGSREPNCDNEMPKKDWMTNVTLGFSLKQPDIDPFSH